MVHVEASIRAPNTSNGVHHLTEVDACSDKMEPIAVIGLSLKFPQDAVSVDKFWQLLMEGRSAMTEVPADRFNISAFYHPDATRTNATNVRGGHFVKGDIAEFDAPFFSITPAEASCMEPMQRGLLESAYKALENAGIPLPDLVGSKTSVHVGSFTREYETILLRDPEIQAQYMATGTGTAMLANRLSWFFNLVGPSIAIDTACSSSLLALHLACQSIRCGESKMGIVAGCNLFYNPDLMIPMTNLNFLSPDSKCYSFDHRANGYSRGEGFGVVIIKPLSDALRDGNTIRAVIRATGSNQDGRTPGITQPSGIAQETLMRETYLAGGLDLKTTRYFEAHGTGTAIGDPLEAGAIGAVFGSERTEEEPLFVGALKSNIGHLEGASGIAGLIKSILVLERGVIPPNIWYEKPNPRILTKKWNIKFPVEPTLWPTDTLRRASVNSFGYGGSNVHVVLDDAKNYLSMRNLDGIHCTTGSPFKKQEIHDSVEDILPRLLVWSAADEGGLERLAAVYREHLAESECDGRAPQLMDLAYTLCVKRSSLSWKSFIVAKSTSDLNRRLNSPLPKAIRSARAPNLGYVFTGQGAQECGMGRDLLIYSTFRDSLNESDQFFRTIGCQWSVIDELSKSREESNINTPALSQPLCTALQVALIDLLRGWGINPSTVVGHSSGEIAAAYCTGSISRESAWKIAYYRGIVSAHVACDPRNRGSMMAVGLSKVRMQSYLDNFEKINPGQTKLVIGCINSPSSVTVSGDENQLDELKIFLDEHEIFARKLKVDVAYHSADMNAVASLYKSLIGSIDPGDCQSSVSMFSSVTGKKISPSQLQEADYWVKNLVSPVQFMDAVTAMSSGSPDSSNKRTEDESSIDHFVEIGPHSALQGPLKSILKSIKRDERVGYSSVMIRNTSAIESALATVGRLFCLGYKVDMMEVNNFKGETRQPIMLTDLPEYPFNHSQRYWHESRLSKEFRFRQNPPHDYLGTTVRDWNPLEPRWRHFLRLSESPWLQDHKVNGVILYPASGMLVMAIEALRQISARGKSIKGYKFKEVSFIKAIQISEDPNGLETSFVLRPRNEDSTFIWYEFRLCTYQNEAWVENCKGQVGVEYEDGPDEVDVFTTSDVSTPVNRPDFDGRDRCSMLANKQYFYKKLETFGIGFGPCFQTLHDLSYSNNGEATATIFPRDWTTKISSIATTEHVIHPTALDAVLQIIFLGLSKGGKNSIPTLVPTKIQEMWLDNSLLKEQPENRRIQIHSKSIGTGLRETDSDVVAVDDLCGGLRIRVTGLQATAVADPTATAKQSLPSRLCFRIDSQPDLDFLSEEETIAYCSETAGQVEDTDKTVEEVELACFLSISNVLRKVDRDAIPASKPHILKYYDWLKHQLERCERGSIIHATPEWKQLISDADYQASLFQRVENSNPEGRVCMAVAKNVEAILLGKVDALALLFDDALLDDYYRWGFENGNGSAKITAYLDAFAHKNPDLNILEIGAGTGSGTFMVIDALTRDSEVGMGVARYSQYTFTDISSSFFEKAKEKLVGRKHRMEFNVLDISEDPVAQGFKEESYDLVIAVNVLHATPNLDSSLRNARKMMKPGAKLMIFEICNVDLLRSGFVFGLLPGWWLGTEPERKWGPILPEAEWNKVLSRNGFSGTEIILRDHQSDRLHLGSAIFSTAVDPLEDIKLPAPSPILIVAEEQSALQQEVANLLQTQLMSFGSLQCEVINFDEITRYDSIKTCCIFLPELKRPFLSQMDAKKYAVLHKIITSQKAILWVTRGGGNSQNPEFDLVTGFARCIRTEYISLNFVTLALDPLSTVPEFARTISQVFEKTMLFDQTSVEQEFIQKKGMIHINRIVESNALNQHVFSKTVPQKAEPQQFRKDKSRPLALSISSPGLLNTIQFIDDDMHSKPLGSDEVEIEVKATGLNFKDILVMLSQVPSQYIGVECAGVISRVGSAVNRGLKPGDRVLCVATGTYKTYVRSSAALVAKMPDWLSYVSAAALPVAYGTALYSIYDVGRMKQGSSILIHCGAGGVGQAAIQLAALVTPTSNIYVTVGNEEKVQLMVERYGIPRENIFSSRSLAFVEGIKRMTKNRGVDLVLNSLAGEKLRRSCECVAPFGHFIEIGLKDILSYGALPLTPFSKNLSFSSVDISVMIRDCPENFGKVLQDVMTLLVEQKIKIEVPHVYSYSHLEDAFRFLQSGKNMGKVVAELHENDIVPVVPDMRSTYRFDSDASYLISGGLGGVGRSITRWMAARGARYFILLSRSGASSEAARQLLDEMEKKEVKILTPACDISSESSLEAVLSECAKTFPPIKGCIQAAMDLRDSIFENMTLESFQSSLKPKVSGSWNLHNQLPKGMDFFILLSSVVGILGGRSQSSYAAGNTFEDALAKHRVVRGEKAVSLDLGMIMGAGFVAENPEVENNLVSIGYKRVEEAQLHAILDYYCDPSLPLLSPTNSQLVVGIETPAVIKANGIETPYWLHQPICRNLFKMDNDIAGPSNSEAQIDYKSLLQSADSLPSARDVVCAALIEKLSKLLSIPVENIDVHSSINSYGTDSLVAVELKNWLLKEVGADIAILEILGNMGISDFSDTVVERSSFVNSVVRKRKDS